MAERETREFITPGGHKVVLHSYLTGRETNQIKSQLYGAVKMTVGQQAQSEKVSGDIMVQQEEKAIELMLVSLDGSSENSMSRLLDLPAAEYEAVKVEVDKLTNPTKPENSAQPGSATSQAA